MLSLGGVCPKSNEEERSMTKKNKSAIASQCAKLFKHTRSGSYGTRARYESSCAQFVSFLDANFKLQNLRNLQDKHLVAYLQYRQEQGLSAKTLKNDLAAIRFLHDMVPQSRHELSDNDVLAKTYDVYLDKTPAVKGDRAWTEEEYKGMQTLAAQMAQKSDVHGVTARDVRDLLPICRTMGLRIAEAVCMRRAQAEQALRTGVYKVGSEAKNGLHREVPLSSEVREILEERLQHIPRGGRLFAPESVKVHQVINRVEKFLERHRGLVVTSEGQQRRLYEGKSAPLTYHGLRYGYVQDRMHEEMAKGCSYEQAAQVVTKEVGHSRIDVIATYMGGR